MTTRMFTGDDYDDFFIGQWIMMMLCSIFTKVLQQRDNVFICLHAVTALWKKGQNVYCWHKFNFEKSQFVQI